MDICIFFSQYYSSGNIYLHLSSVGLILNVLTIIGLIASSDFRTTNMFRYLLLKAFCDLGSNFANLMLCAYFAEFNNSAAFRFYV